MYRIYERERVRATLASLGRWPILKADASDWLNFAAR